MKKRVFIMIILLFLMVAVTLRQGNPTEGSHPTTVEIEPASIKKFNQKSQKPRNRQSRVQGLVKNLGQYPLLVSRESELGDITNVYYFSPTNVVTQVIEALPVERLFGSYEYERLARLDYEKTISKEPNLAEIKSVLEDWSIARDSGFIYSGVREVYAARARFRELRESKFDNDKKISDLMDTALNSTDPVIKANAAEQGRNLMESKSVLLMIDTRDCPERARQRLIDLYGELPVPIFQRLMSIDIVTTPEGLSLP